MPSFFRKVIKKKNKSTNDSGSQQPQSENEKDSSVNPLQYIVGSGQSVGKLRDHNEDTLFSATSLLSDGRSEELFGLFVIADGMRTPQRRNRFKRFSTCSRKMYWINCIKFSLIRSAPLLQLEFRKF